MIRSMAKRLVFASLVVVFAISAGGCTDFQPQSEYGALLYHALKARSYTPPPSRTKEKRQPDMPKASRKNASGSLTIPAPDSDPFSTP
ncbi:MAG: hypothetical protein GX442_25410 [Candidatus Riflebacteria bacterium]|nr:hypothetical protein [Candidatus Riflebacteria bacterium]